LARNSASFRDPAGHVYEKNGRIFRTITEHAIQEYSFLRDQGVLDRLVDKGLLIESRETSLEEAGLDDSSGARLVVEHPRIPFVSYPYEWSFRALQAAALHHLELQIEALDLGAALSDATSYNIQFKGVQPIFIDLLSLRPYREGEYWAGYRQFCEQFLNPLLLRAYTGVAHNAWYRGSPEGIPAAELSRLLPLRRKLSPKTFAHVVLHGRLQDSAGSPDKAKSVKAGKFSRNAYLGMLHQLRSWIAGLHPAGDRGTVWQDYADTHSYSQEEHQKKKAFVSAFVESVRPGMLWDIGCNSGDFSDVALQSGAGTVIGFDFDQGALDAAFVRAKEGGMNFLPLFQDATNPSPDQGWRQAERNGLGERRDADALLGLALIHHLAIGRNIPLPDVIDWLTGFAPQGVVEFVPKDDPMIQRMLMLREDIFDGYDYDRFSNQLNTRARIVREQRVSQSGRMLVWYERLA
jgi:ribosomal protein L11 methylase PrmA